MANHRLKEILCILYSSLLFVSGLVLIVVSVILCYRTFYHFTFIPSNTLGPLILLLILGVIHILLTWLGVNAPLRANNVHLILFMVFTVILLISELAIGVWSMVLWSEVSLISVDLQTKSFIEMRETCDKNSWIKVQREFECCGLNGVDNYDKEECKSTCVASKFQNNTTPVYYISGCQDVFVSYAKRILLDGTILGFLAAFYHILGIFIFSIFFRSLREERQKHRERLSARQALASAASQPGPETPLVYSVPPSDNVTPPSPPVTTSPPTTPAQAS